jgi:hypothetical protein
MKKILTTFLISLTLLTFSNTASAGFFGDFVKDFFGEVKKVSLTDKGAVNNVRCMVEYTQLDLSTGLEKTVKHTDQNALIGMAEEDSILYLMTQDLTDKINIWLNESPNNVIADMTVINCKERRLYKSKVFVFMSEQRWGKYKGCPDEYNIKLIDFLERPKQWGYNVHKERLIKDYEEGCKNYTSDYIPTDMY